MAAKAVFHMVVYDNGDTYMMFDNNANKLDRYHRNLTMESVLIRGDPPLEDCVTHKVKTDSDIEKFIELMKTKN